MYASKKKKSGRKTTGKKSLSVKLSCVTFINFGVSSAEIYLINENCYLAIVLHLQHKIQQIIIIICELRAALLFIIVVVLSKALLLSFAKQ